MMKVLLVIFPLLLILVRNDYKVIAEDDARVLSTALDNLRYLFIGARRLNWYMSDTTNNMYKNNLHNGKTQSIIKNSTKFLCDTKNGPGRRSLTPPNSINKLRPGDVDIIAAMGDSITAGNGAFSQIITHIVNEYRSVAWSGGGYGNWRQFLTLPNILKVFNPNLYGFAIGNGLTIDKKSRFNLAEPLALSVDMPYQARALINRMKADPKVNMKKHWKVVTIFIGNLDLCMSSCYTSSLEKWVDLHEKDLIKTLRILRDNVPRLLVNLVSFPNIHEILKFNKGFTCYIVHHFACFCLSNSILNKEKSLNAIRMWNAKDTKVAAMDEFNTETFAVTIQPFLTNMSLINKNSGSLDFELVASDCLHFSQKAHAIAAISLWNNMLQPIGTKQTTITDELICPTEDYPYFATRNNSIKLKKIF